MCWPESLVDIFLPSEEARHKPALLQRMAASNPKQAASISGRCSPNPPWVLSWLDALNGLMFTFSECKVLAQASLSPIPCALSFPIWWAVLQSLGFHFLITPHLRLLQCLSVLNSSMQAAFRMWAWDPASLHDLCFVQCSPSQCPWNERVTKFTHSSLK